uniref:Uncharacterized protein n=1 Tax=Spongospora subterranea TaxID=70186 RepID=A0A0H5RGG2_9EUKA|eukprot:CRZ07764.1 hypothetical protein [Spongospora subterranea]
MLLASPRPTDPRPGSHPSGRCYNGLSQLDTRLPPSAPRSSKLHEAFVEDAPDIHAAPWELPLESTRCSCWAPSGLVRTPGSAVSVPLSDIRLGKMSDKGERDPTGSARPVLTFTKTRSGIDAVFPPSHWPLPGRPRSSTVGYPALRTSLSKVHSARTCYDLPPVSGESLSLQILL